MRHLIKSNGGLCNSIDIRLYIALLLYRAIIHKAISYMYYTQDRLFETPRFKRILPQKRLLLIEKYVHFVDIAELGNTYCRYAKIEPIHSYLVERWQSLLALECEVSVDETLLLRKGCLSWKEYIKTQRARFGIKMFALAEASSGYIWNSITYSGDDTLIDEGNKYQYQATSIVMTLMKKVLDEGRCLYVDNWYSSIELLDELRKRSTDVIDTVRKDQKWLPKDILNAKLKVGEKGVAYSLKYSAMCMQWKDKRDVRMLTSCIPDKNVIVKRRGKEKAVPLIIDTYNNGMGGVNLLDQMMSSYPLERKRLKKIVKKMWLHLVNTCFFNSQILHQKRGDKFFVLEFDSKLISQIVEKYEYGTDTFRKGVRSSTVENPSRLMERHVPSYVLAIEKEANATCRCGVCKKHGAQSRLSAFNAWP